VNKLLSQDEVDALLKGLDTGDIDAEEDPDESAEELEALDWNRKSTNVNSSMPLLQVVGTRFTQKLKTDLSSSLRKLVDVSADPMETIKFSDFQRSLPIPTSMHFFTIEPLRGVGILIIESRLVFSLLETYFGGKGVGSTKMEGREFTTIENRIIKKIVQMALARLSESWEEVYPIKTEFIRSESNPLVVNVFHGEELLVNTRFEIEMNKPLGKITICMPVSTFQPIRHKLAGGYRVGDDRVDQVWVSKLQERIKETDVEMVVHLGSGKVSVKDLMNLHKGDIIMLEKNFREPLKASIEGIEKYEGFAARHRNRKVFRVESAARSQS
jgi:flagellar motor switch protein FliM